MSAKHTPQLLLSPKQRHIIEHALGVGRGNHRNHFVTGPGSDDFDDCRALVAVGCMREYAGNELTGGDSCFQVTPQGRSAIAKATGEA